MTSIRGFTERPMKCEYAKRIGQICCVTSSMSIREATCNVSAGILKSSHFSLSAAFVNAAQLLFVSSVLRHRCHLRLTSRCGNLSRRIAKGVRSECRVPERGRGLCLKWRMRRSAEPGTTSVGFTKTSPCRVHMHAMLVMCIFTPIYATADVYISRVVPQDL